MTAQRGQKSGDSRLRAVILRQRLRHALCAPSAAARQGVPGGKRAPSHALRRNRVPRAGLPSHTPRGGVPACAPARSSTACGASATCPARRRPCMRSGAIEYRVRGFRHMPRAAAPMHAPRRDRVPRAELPPHAPRGGARRMRSGASRPLCTHRSAAGRKLPAALPCRNRSAAQRHRCAADATSNHSNRHPRAQRQAAAAECALHSGKPRAHSDLPAARFARGTALPGARSWRMPLSRSSAAGRLRG